MIVPGVVSSESGVSDAPCVRRGGRFRKAEVEQLRAGGRQHDVPRLEIPMDDGGSMRGVECRGDLNGAVERIFDRQRSLRKPVRERLAVQKLHDEVRHRALACRGAVRTDVVERADVRVIQSGNDARFPLEALTRGFVGGDVRQEHFDRDGPPQSRVARAIDLAHAAAADSGFQAERTELRACQVLIRPRRDSGHARRFEKIMGAFVRVEQRRYLAVENLVPEACVCHELHALAGRQRDGSIEDVSDAPPLFGPQGGHDL